MSYLYKDHYLFLLEVIYVVLFDFETKQCCKIGVWMKANHHIRNTQKKYYAISFYIIIKNPDSLNCFIVKKSIIKLIEQWIVGISDQTYLFKYNCYEKFTIQAEDNNT